jgi:hypothetical protein
MNPHMASLVHDMIDHHGRWNSIFLLGAAQHGVQPTRPAAEVEHHF